VSDPPSDRLELVLENRRAEIQRAHNFLDSVAAQFQWPTKLTADLHVAIEEHLANIIHHGYDPGQSGHVTIRFHPGSGEIRVEIEDDARPFNPLLVPPVDVTRPIEARPVGGLGVHLIRQLTDQLDYQHRNHRNRLVLLKRLSPPAPT
jgi:anti-sigma regulatory factor (Ser/Thr protein kinase)